MLLSDGRPEDYDDGGDRRYLHALDVERDSDLDAKRAMAARRRAD